MTLRYLAKPWKDSCLAETLSTRDCTLFTWSRLTTRILHNVWKSSRAQPSGSFLLLVLNHIGDTVVRHLITLRGWTFAQQIVEATGFPYDPSSQVILSGEPLDPTSWYEFTEATVVTLIRRVEMAEEADNSEETALLQVPNLLFSTHAKALKELVTESSEDYQICLAF